MKALEKEELTPANSSGVTTAVKNVGTSAEALVSALKSEFAPQTSAIKSSLSAIEKSGKEVSSASSTSAKTTAAVAIPGEITAIKNAAAEMQKVTKSHCE